MSPARILPVGDAALSVELGDGIDPAISARVLALETALLEAQHSAVLETLPSYRALLVVFDPRRGDAAGVARLVDERLARVTSDGAGPAGRRHRLRVCYDGVDLESVAARTGMTRDELIALHSGAEYGVMMLGFRPGFGYLGLTDARLEVPRLATPRARVPAGAVALAGRQTAVYPAASPGGWNLIGRTDARLFDPEAAEPARLRPGDRVAFEPVRELEALPPLPSPAGSCAQPAFEVLEPGLLTTVQDLGRHGRLRIGVCWGGAADRPAALAANRVLANSDGDALLEVTGAGLALRFLRPLRFCVCGADLGALLERADLGQWPVPQGRAVLARAGNLLRFSQRRQGLRGYLAVAGGIDVPLVLGSRATDLSSGFGGLAGRALRAGDRLGVAAEATGAPSAEPAPAPSHASAVTLRVVPGPQADHFGPEALRALYSEEFRVAANSDRTGCRLEGARVTARPPEIVSDGMLPGAIQVPPGGAPIVMLADAPSAGGYPKPGVVIAADLAKLAQLVPGEGRVRFEPLPPLT